ncbi:MAG TPA: 5'-methylthioadenosine phosphorylase, partial [Burkholderiaceae bacterium]|nr:5'-methylthioadenosine phosphorylase [Burkholderiaceae bacterium]
GMTGMPEACLAREAELEYATLAVVVNHAAGRGDSQELVALDTLESVLAEAIKRAVCVIEAALSVDN